MTISLHSIKEDAQPDLVACKIDGDNESIESSILDMLGYQGVVFLVSASKGEAANLTIKGQQGAASNMSDAADLAGTSVAFSTAIGTDGFAFLEIKNPVERYVRSVVAVPNVTTPISVSVVAIRYGKNWLPETNADGELHVSPAEGTA